MHPRRHLFALLALICAVLCVRLHRSVPSPVKSALRPASASLPTPTLLQKATNVLSMEDYSDLEGGFSTYRWLSDGQLLLTHYSSFHFPPAQLFRYDLRTQSRTRLKGLSRLVGCLYKTQIEVSPDGKWLLWHGGTDNAETLDAATLDGKQHIQWPRGHWRLHNITWTQDSRHWIEFQNLDSTVAESRLAILHDVQNPRQLVAYGVVPESVLPVSFPTVAAGDRLFTVANPDDQGTSDPIEVIETSLDPTARPLQRHTIAPPPGLLHPVFLECYLSPQGDQVAMLLREIPPSQSDSEKQTRYSLWVSDIDGGHQREIGNWYQNATQFAISEIEGLRWLPDGKRLSFVYENRLYTVPAE